MTDKDIYRLFGISIHAPRTGSDVHHMAHTVDVPVISIHAPRTGSDSLFSSG